MKIMTWTSWNLLRSKIRVNQVQSYHTQRVPPRPAYRPKQPHTHQMATCGRIESQGHIPIVLGHLAGRSAGGVMDRIISAGAIQNGHHEFEHQYNDTELP